MTRCGVGHPGAPERRGETYRTLDDQPGRLSAGEERFEASDSRTVDHLRNSQPNRVLAAVLFSDIAGSTARAVALGDHRWTELLDQHDEVARRCVERYEGRVIKRLGDGALAIFPRPSLAVEAACAIRRLLHPVDLRLRFGIHTGEVQLRQGDVAGVAVHVAQRVARLAPPGEILVSATVKDLVLGNGFAFRCGGRHSLPGIPGRWALFAVRQQ